MPTTPKLRLFISFSGHVGRSLGAALFEWLKTLSPSFAPFMSDRDISAGSWSPQWMKALRTSVDRPRDVGIQAFHLKLQYCQNAQ